MARMNRTYRYPPALRVLGLFGSMLAGGILLGSLLAEIEAADPVDFALHVLGAMVSVIIIWLGVEFGTRRITPMQEGISTRLLRERRIRWGDARIVPNGLFGALTIAPKRGAPILVWPYLQDFDVLIEILSESQTRAQLTDKR
jgi:hypothetical protein